MKKEPTEVKLDLATVKFDIKKRWALKDDSVDEATAINMIQFLTPEERIHFVNELYRVMKKGGKAQIVTPHFACNRAYGDLAFQWPPVVENWYWHLNAEWRKTGNPKEKRYKCDFTPTWGYGLHPLLISRSMEYQQNAITFYKEAAQDLVVTLAKN